MAVKQTYIEVDGSTAIPTNNLLETTASKIGIQAPATTKFEIDGHIIQVGRSQIYELGDVGFNIASVKLIVKPATPLAFPVLVDYITAEE